MSVTDFRNETETLDGQCDPAPGTIFFQPISKHRVSQVSQFRGQSFRARLMISGLYSKRIKVIPLAAPYEAKSLEDVAAAMLARYLKSKYGTLEWLVSDGETAAFESSLL